MDDAFDLERLRVDPADLQRRPKRKKWRRHYALFPWKWVRADAGSQPTGDHVPTGPAATV